MGKSWNPVLNKVIEIKHAYVDKFGTDGLLDKANGRTCFELWIEKLENKEYRELTKFLQFDQNNEMLLVRYARYGNIYNELDDVTDEDFWDMEDGFYRECRSVVINLINEDLITVPFRKFRNLDECEETSLANIEKRIKSARTVEYSNKLDGSMQCARLYRGNIVMTSAQSTSIETSWRLADGYRMLTSQEEYVELISDFPDITFVFEYISLKDAHVVKYTKEQEGLYLIGMRSVNTGGEFSYNSVLSVAKTYGVKTTTVFDKTLEEVLSEMDSVTSDKAEGFVLNIDGFKVKIKYNDYCKVHKILERSASTNVIIKNIADNTWDDFISKIPVIHRDSITKISKEVFSYIRTMNEVVDYYFDKYKDLDKKEFMISVENNVPKDLKGYVRTKYLGNELNFLKGQLGSKNPCYKNIIEIRELMDKINNGGNVWQN